MIDQTARRGALSRRSRFLAFAFLAVFLSGADVALAQRTSLPGYTRRSWTTQDGLPQNPIRTLTQTRDGYLWLGTANAGLVRFDGLSFTAFDVANTPELPSNWISTLFEDADGALWIGTSQGLVRYHGGRFTANPLGPEFAQAFITTVLADGRGRLWVGTTERLLRREGDGWVPINVGQTDIGRFFVERDGSTVWVVTARGLIQWRDGTTKVWSEAEGLPSRRSIVVYQDRSGQLWVGTERGLARFDRATNSMQREPSPELSGEVECLFEDSGGVLWVGIGPRLLGRRRDGTVSVDITSRGLGIVSDVSEDREGHLWVASNGPGGGIHRFRRETVSVLADAEEMPCDNVAPITQGPDGTVWLGTFCRDTGNVVAIRNGRLHSYAGPGVVSALLAEPDGAVWAGTYGGGLFRRSGDRFVPEPLPGSFLNVAVMAIHRDPQKVLWLATNRGLFRQQDGRWTIYRQEDGLPSDDVRTVVDGADGTLWVGTALGLAQYVKGRFTNYTAEQGMPRGPVRAIHIDREGTIWLGTYGGGLARLKNGTITAYGTQEGVLDSSVHRILEDDRGYFWLSGDRGIRRVSRRELEQVADGTVPRVTALVFDEADGMKSAECNGMGQPAGERMRDGTLWFPTQDGVVRINPTDAERRATSMPTPAIEQVMFAGHANDRAGRRLATPVSGGALAAATGVSEIEVRYTAPAFWRPEHVQFRYRLDGYDSDWIEGGNRRVAHYANLRPGNYTFRVIARHPGGQWTDQAATLALTLPPRWYQRRWAQLVAALLLVVAALVAMRWRVARYRRRTRDLERTVRDRTAEIERQRDEIRAAHDRLTATTAQVAQSHEQVLSVLNQLEISALVLAADGTIRYATEPARRLLESEAAPLVGCAWTECLPLSDAERAQIAARFDAPPPSRTRFPVQVSIRGRRYWMAIDVRDEPSPGTGRILYLSDVTEVFGLRGHQRGGEPFPDIVGNSGPIQLVFKQIRDVAGTDVTVLIEGETGSGKELVARAIHRASRRAAKPFVAVNTAGLTESLIASQLFGHRRGAFTGAVADQVGLFEAAQGGTLFLDEIGDIPLSVQPSLLRVLQEREITRLGDTASRNIDVRIVAATHHDLAREAAEGRFRQDLLYRIRVVTIKLPALRERVDDVPGLVERFLTEASAAAGKDVRGIASEAMDRLLLYSWPGNVRELRSAIEQAVVRAQGQVLRPEHFPIEIVRGVPVTPATDADERERLADALRRAGGNRSEAARLLGIGRATLYRKLAAHGLVDR
jgi:transcriptional regulator with PAS, ATPase and Fis domain/ligand-binding sensor domain-containing protein